MSNVSADNARIARNTAYLYVRMFVTMIVSLYTSRIVLKVLGASDYGLYSVVGGIVFVFSVISDTLTLGTERFLNYAMGENDFLKLQKTFSISLTINIVASLIILLLAETLGLWFLNYKINIPPGRETAAFWVYQFSVVMFIVNLIQIPFNGSIIAHEQMNVFAIMSIFDAVMKLLIVILLQFLVYDKLILYSALMLMIGLISMLIYNIYCHRNYAECRWRLMWDRKLAAQILTYSGWNMFGSGVSFATGQGINILLNIFCGTVVNAARAISVTVSWFVGKFAINVQTAVNPQLIKMYAAGEYDKMYRLTVNSCRVNAYIFLSVAIPLAIEMEYVLRLWLGEYPENTAIFSRIALVQMFLYVLDRPLIVHINAAGKMKMPNLTDGIALLMALPISYLVLKLGYGPVAVCWVNALIWLCDNFFSVYWPNKYTGIPVKMVLKEVYANVFIGGTIMFLVPYIVSHTMADGLLQFLVVGLVSVVTSFSVVYLWGMTKGMRKVFLEKIHVSKSS